MTASPEQITALGKAARDLLRFAWARTPRDDLVVINGLIAVSKTFASDPVASGTLLRQTIEPDHLKENGYKELSWVARQIKVIAQYDPDMAVDIYAAAYGFAEVSSGTTSVGNSVILSLRSNRRQDYESAWYALSEAIPGILDASIEAGVRAIVQGLDGYVKRERHYDPFPDEPGTGSFAFGSFTANFKADWSHSWYRSGGFQPVQDGPVLLKKFDDFLYLLASANGAKAKFGQVIDVLSREPSVVAAIWGSLLVAGTQHPSVWAQQLLPLACAAPIMLSSDTRYQLGSFVGAAYAHFAEHERGTIERAILALSDDRSGERSKAALAGCIPTALIATDEMRAFIKTLEQTGKARENLPPFRITSSVSAFDTDAYLASEGVSLEDPESAALRELMREVEALSLPAGTPDLSLKSVTRQLVILERLRSGLVKRFRGKVPDTLFEHATGLMADAAGRIARAVPRVLAVSLVRKALKRILLFCTASKNPHYNAEHERNFHGSVSWGGPSARTSAATGLLNLIRADKKRDPQITTAIRKLARDRVPEVRLQIVQSLAMMRILDPVWAWSEVEYALAKEKTRGVVESAIGALGGLAYQDIARSVHAAKGLIRRYRNQNKPGMAACQASAANFIFDIHINAVNAEADEFADALMGDLQGNADHIRQLVARYSDNLLKGSLTNPLAPDNRPRQQTLALYAFVTERAFLEIESRAARYDMSKFDTWPEPELAVVRSMFGILDEVSLRLHFAAGTHYDGSVPANDISPQCVRLYQEAKPIFVQLANASVATIAHYLIQALENFIPLEPSGIFELITRSVKFSVQGGYSNEAMAVDLIVRIVQRYLADYRAIFVNRARLDDLMDCLDIFVRAGWPAAQSLTFKLGDIWR